MSIEESSFRSTWLCPRPADRARMLDMEQRLKGPRNLALASLAVALVASGHWVGWWTLAPLVGVGAGFVVGGRGVDRTARPEYRMALAWLASELLIAVSVAVSGGPRSPALAWIVIPMITLPARFRLRGVLAGSVVALAALVAVGFGVDAGAVIHNPSSFIFTFAMIVAVSVLSLALMRSDVDHRSVAVIDPLTSMLNRNALGTRVTELTQQARINGQPVAVIVADLDRFKAVNDRHGHAVGDAVLRDVAYRIRAELRAYDLAYRLGGEEFLVLVPGAGIPEAAQVAERLRSVIEDQKSSGLSVTMSFGVSGSSSGAFDYGTVFDAADRALYGAKAAGGNCVQVAAPCEADEDDDFSLPAVESILEPAVAVG
jgi:diguanylate cyclase (GGDEF)-like protein